MNDWKENVDWYEAATAFRAGTHDVQWSNNGVSWADASIFGERNKYRIRLKQRTITVTIPRPDHVDSGCSPYPLNLLVLFSKEAERETAYDAIRAAMEQQT